MNTDHASPTSSSTLLTVKRIFEASPELVFNAWLDAASMRQWLFATPGGEMQTVEVDPRVGGKFVVVEKRGEQLAEHFGTYLEIEPHHRLVFSFATNRDQQPTRVTVELRKLSRGCELTLSHEMDPRWASYLDRARAGWTMIVDHLGEVLSQGREIVLSRLLNAPREVVFRAWSDPQHLIQWWGPKGFTNTFAHHDFRPGGTWKYIMHGPDGTDYANLMIFTEIEPPARIAYKHCEQQEDEPGQFYGIATFEERGAQTLLTMRLILATAAEREMMIREVGAFDGGNQTIDRLEQHLQKMLAE